MTSFVHVDQPSEHPGVVRAERAVATVSQAIHELISAKGAATLLLAAIVAAMVVVANQVIETWSDGHLLAAWIAMWTVAFAALALFAGPARSAVYGVRGYFAQWAAARRAAAQDDELWRLAMTDARVMADISRAMSADAARDVRRYY